MHVPTDGSHVVCPARLLLLFKTVLRKLTFHLYHGTIVMVHVTRAAPLITLSRSPMMLRRALLLVALLPCDALVVGLAAGRATGVAARARPAQLGLFDGLKGGGKTDTSFMPAVDTIPNPASFSMEELKALQEAR